MKKLTEIFRQLRTAPRRWLSRLVRWARGLPLHIKLRILRRILLDEMVKAECMDLIFEVKDTKPRYTFEIHIRLLEPESGDQSKRHPDTEAVIAKHASSANDQALPQAGRK